ncbi:unnamed protein product [Ectocarpus sp. 6 AP-2014]
MTENSDVSTSGARALAPLHITAKHIYVAKAIGEESYSRRVQMSGRLKTVGDVVDMDMVEWSDGVKWSERLLGARGGQFVFRTLPVTNFSTREISHLLLRSWVDQMQVDAIWIGKSSLWQLWLSPAGALKKLPTNVSTHTYLEQVSINLGKIIPTVGNINSVLSGLGGLRQLEFDAHPEKWSNPYKVSGYDKSKPWVLALSVSVLLLRAIYLGLSTNTSSNSNNEVPAPGVRVPVKAQPSAKHEPMQFPPIDPDWFVRSTLPTSNLASEMQLETVQPPRMHTSTILRRVSTRPGDLVNPSYRIPPRTHDDPTPPGWSDRIRPQTPREPTAFPPREYYRSSLPTSNLASEMQIETVQPPTMRTNTVPQTPREPTAFPPEVGMSNLGSRMQVDTVPPRPPAAFPPEEYNRSSLPTSNLASEMQIETVQPPTMRTNTVPQTPREPTAFPPEVGMSSLGSRMQLDTVPPRPHAAFPPEEYNRSSLPTSNLASEMQIETVQPPTMRTNTVPQTPREPTAFPPEVGMSNLGSRMQLDTVPPRPPAAFPPEEYNRSSLPTSDLASGMQVVPSKMWKDLEIAGGGFALSGGVVRPDQDDSQTEDVMRGVLGDDHDFTDSDVHELIARVNRELGAMPPPLDGNSNFSSFEWTLTNTIMHFVASVKNASFLRLESYFAIARDVSSMVLEHIDGVESPLTNEAVVEMTEKPRAKLISDMGKIKKGLVDAPRLSPVDLEMPKNVKDSFDYRGAPEKCRALRDKLRRLPKALTALDVVDQEILIQVIGSAFSNAVKVTSRKVSSVIWKIFGVNVGESRVAVVRELPQLSKVMLVYYHEFFHEMHNPNGQTEEFDLDWREHWREHVSAVEYQSVLEKVAVRIYRDDDTVDRMLHTLLALPVEVAQQELRAAATLRERLQYLYSEDEFSVNLAMMRLSGQDAVSIEGELDIIRRYAGRGQLAIDRITDKLPPALAEKVRAVLKPTMTIEVMLQTLAPDIVKNKVCPNIIGVYGQCVLGSKSGEPHRPSSAPRSYPDQLAPTERSKPPPRKQQWLIAPPPIGPVDEGGEELLDDWQEWEKMRQRWLIAPPPRTEEPQLAPTPTLSDQEVAPFDQEMAPFELPVEEGGGSLPDWRAWTSVKPPAPTVVEEGPEKMGNAIVGGGVFSGYGIQFLLMAALGNVGVVALDGIANLLL